MAKMAKLTKSEPKFVKMVNLVMQKITCRIVSDAMNNEKKCMAQLAQLAQLAQFEGKCAKSVKSARANF